jgi:pyruvate-formate lyase-activating enzyme
MLLSFLVPPAVDSLLQQKEIIDRLRDGEEQHDQHYHELNRHPLVSLEIRPKTYREVSRAGRRFALSRREERGYRSMHAAQLGYPLGLGQQSHYIPHYL